MDEIQMPQTMPTATAVSQVMQQAYVPSALERKKAMLMYIFFGIFIGIIKKEVTIFELYHLKQATGWWVLALTFGVISLVLIFLPVFKFVPIGIAIVLCICWAICVRQARKGVYVEDGAKSFLSVFSWLGGWLLQLFEISLELTTEQYPQQETTVQTPEEVSTPQPTPIV